MCRYRRSTVPAPTKGGCELRALILDYGEVLSLRQAPGLVDAMATELGIDRETFEPAYWRRRRAYDLGMPASEYWSATLGDLGVTSTTAIPALIDLDVQSWTGYREPMWALAASARAAGWKTAILSNGVPEVMARVGAERDLSLFDAVVVSYEIGHAKPDAEIYEVTLSRVGSTAADGLFVDDRAENIAAAERLGLSTFHFTGDDRMGRFSAFLTAELSK
jgi:putative hydrolase of the HAD superfamily